MEETSLLTLPSLLVASCVLNLLDLTDVVRCDAAVTARRTRMHWLETLQLATVNATNIVILGERIPTWLALRNVCLRTVVLRVSRLPACDPLAAAALQRATNVAVCFHRHSSGSQAQQLLHSDVICGKVTQLCIEPDRYSTDVDWLQIDRAFVQLIRQCSNVTDVTIKWMDDSSNLVLEALIQSQCSLVALHLEYLQDLDAATLMKLLQQCRRLHTLRLANGSGLRAPFLQCPATNCPHLRTLELGNVTDPVVLIAALALLPHLTSLSVHESCVVVEVIQALTVYCPQLTALDARGPLVAPTEVLHSIALLPALKELSLTAYRGVSAHYFEHPVMAQLQHLTLGMGPSRASDADLVELARHCSGLRSLCLRYEFLKAATYPTDCAVSQLVRRNPHMTALTFYALVALTDESLLAIAAACPHLTVLEVYKCRNFTDVGMVAIATSCSKLSRLDVQLCTQLTDTTLHALADHCPRLKKLHGRECPHFSEAGVLYFAQRCRTLECLSGVRPCLSKEACTLISSLRPLRPCSLE